MTKKSAARSIRVGRRGELSVLAGAAAGMRLIMRRAGWRRVRSMAARVVIGSRGAFSFARRSASDSGEYNASRMIEGMEYISVRMVRPSLARIPELPLPRGFRLRLFGRGDRRTWLDIWRASERVHPITVRVFNESMGYDMTGLRRRCLFLVSPDGRDIGTSTAWYDRDGAGVRWGRVHWVAIRPEFRGCGLSKPLVAATLHFLRRLRHRRACLVTQTPRIAAIKAYLDLGFRPDVPDRSHCRAWRLVREHLDHPLLARV